MVKERPEMLINRKFVLQAIMVLVKLPFHGIMANFLDAETYYSNPK